LEGSNDPIVWVFPTILVCLSCGIAELAIPDAERQCLRTEVRVVLQDEQIGG
jgi:hypothetical protein